MEMHYLSGKIKRSLFLVFFLLHSQQGITADTIDDKPYVTCRIRGQLGNQLFQIATTLAHAWDNNMHPIFPELQQTHNNIPANLKRIFYRLDANSLPRPVLSTFEQMDNFEYVEIPNNPDLYLRGYFQTWEYFDHHRDRIREIFSPGASELAKLQLKHTNLLNHPFTVGVHVRTFNKQWSNIIPFVGLKYYKEAMDLFPSDALFVIFSDRINWCKQHFSQFNRQMIFIEDQDHIEDFILMSMLDHNIIGNSSYSWWAAYLNQNPDKYVVAPSHFVHPRIRSTVNANMTEWHTIEVDVNTPYPDDIRKYDIFSQSIDTQ
ncbi:MAG: alpha-1,2-fucosyltransferase [Simkaniaceae bacterium]|nr:alpha-1,2-fucosyltransferase [Candidatus Sacchlamyda saccharinae]